MTDTTEPAEHEGAASGEAFDRLVADYLLEIEKRRAELRLHWLLTDKDASKLIPVCATTIRAEKAEIGYTSFRGRDFFTARLLAIYLAKQSTLPCPRSQSPDPDKSGNTGSRKSPAAKQRPTITAASGTTKPSDKPDSSLLARRTFRPHLTN